MNWEASDMTDEIDGIELAIGTEIAHSIIWLHGLGADGGDFAPLVPELEKLDVTDTRFIFPHAPERAVTINAGMKMRAWYDITSLDFEAREQDETGTIASHQLVVQLVEREIKRGIAAEKIILAGFSQGGAIALYTGTRIKQNIAGILALSTYLPLSDKLDAEMSSYKPPIFMAHGVQDDVIAIKYAESSRERLKSAGYDLQWQAYQMPHSVSAEEIVDIATWIKNVLD